MVETLNKQRLALRLGVSLPTLSKWLLKYEADFPVVARGGNGRDYSFDLAAVVAFLRTKQADQCAAAAATKAAIDETLAGLLLPFDPPDAEPQPMVPSIKDEILAWELRKRQRLEAEAAGLLIPVEQVRSVVMDTLGRLSREQRAFIRQIGREEGWPPAVIQAHEKRLADVQRATVAAWRTEHGTPRPG